MSVNKTSVINDFVIEIGTVNGSGSQSANNILMRSIFRMGIPVGGKNMFPSNIAGLPTWFTIRVNEQGYTARREQVDIFVSLNAQTLVEDLKKLKPGAWFFVSDEIKVDEAVLAPYKDRVHLVKIPFRELVAKATDSIKLKKLLTNMVYVGVLAELLGLDQKVLTATISDQFKGKASALESNSKALNAGIEFAKNELKNIGFPFVLKGSDQNKGKMLVDGNTAAALGFICGGTTFVSWYPITPSSSVVENYMNLSDQYRKEADGKMKGAIVQAEDELAAICMVAGAGWSGARAMTATSGPGLSLMAETAGFFYYSEVPGVVWDVQRVGPSTGMPTRTAQGDILFAYSLSHGDTKHVLLLPGNMDECFEFAMTSHDLAERLQTLIIVLSDLDLGMNFWSTPDFNYPVKSFDRGKLLTEKDLEKVKSFQRYKDLDGDGIPYRTIPGTRDPHASYFTRGSGHTESGQYTENSEAYQKVIDRLQRKYETAKTLVPKPILQKRTGATSGIIAFGSSDLPMQEALDHLEAKKYPLDYLRLRAVPFDQSVEDFIKDHEVVYVVDQNRDGQMRALLGLFFPHLASKLRSILHYDGMPLTAKNIYEPLESPLKK